MTSSPRADVARAQALADQVLAAAPRSPLAHWSKAQVLRALTRFDEAIPEYEALLVLNPNSPNALHLLGQCKFFTGAIDETIPLEEQAIRLSPRDPQIGNWYELIGRVHLLRSRKGRGAPIRGIRTLTFTLPRRMPLRATLNAHARNSPKPKS
jgi:tetratricopeptide (TPR) repeat protein